MSKQIEALKLALEWYDSGKEDRQEFETLMRRLLAGQPAQQQSAERVEPVAWQILNGVCHAGIRSTEGLAKEAAAGMQKTHDLGGSLAAFHVRPLYTSPQPSKPWVGLTDEERRACTQSPFAVENYLSIEAKLKEKNT